MSTVRTPPAVDLDAVTSLPRPLALTGSSGSGGVEDGSSRACGTCCAICWSCSTSQAAAGALSTWEGRGASGPTPRSSLHGCVLNVEKPSDSHAPERSRQTRMAARTHWRREDSLGRSREDKQQTSAGT